MSLLSALEQRGIRGDITVTTYLDEPPVATRPKETPMKSHAVRELESRVATLEREARELEADRALSEGRIRPEQRESTLLCLEAAPEPTRTLIASTPPDLSRQLLELEGMTDEQWERAYEEHFSAMFGGAA